MLDLLLPQRCVACGVGGSQLCRACLAALPRVPEPLCERCGAPTVVPVARCRECAGRRLPFASARAAVEYDAAVRRLVSAWKERGLRRLAVVAAEIVAGELRRPSVQALAYVPPDRNRSLQRGHHPAERLARELARLWELPALPLLARAGTATPQRGLSHEARRRNVAGAFRPAGLRAPGSVCLVDDVYTTGATVAAAASALRRAGARRVEVVTFARTIRER